jgi:DNA polymerase III subunit epsilon
MNTAEHWQRVPIAALDVETTGFDIGRDRVIEVGIVHLLEGRVTERYGQLINPGIPIPRAVRELTGIQQEDVDDAPTFAEVAQELAARLEGRCLVGYNLAFDRSFLTAELGRCGLAWPKGPTLDPLVFARALLPWLKRKTLGEVAAELGVDLREAHRAKDDAEAAGLVLYAFGDRLPADLASLLTLQSQWERTQEQSSAIRRGRELAFDGALGAEAVVVALGPAYLYGDEVDPYRALLRALPDARTKHRASP